MAMPFAPSAVVGILAAVALAAAVPAAGEPEPAVPGSHAERMAALGLVRHDGAWRTPQEVELRGRAERDAAARREWSKKLERLRRALDRGGASAAEEIREISDPLAVPALVAALHADPDGRVRGLYVEALSHVRSPDAAAALVATALDHADPETRIAAVERLEALGPALMAPAFVAALASPDNARVNRAAEALGRLREPSAVAPLIASLETTHVVMQGDGAAPGSTTATFTPAGGGLSMGGGPKPVKVQVRNDRVLEALVALTGQNLSWDGAAWRRWLAARECPDFDPRRAP
ncbi:MAG: HEAT repeat domain-containing protein [Planctomycetaceae bacterium]